jgi:hypothetical protein
MSKLWDMVSKLRVVVMFAIVDLVYFIHNAAYSYDLYDPVSNFTLLAPI